ncbi:MAG: hypothetical protein QF903_11405 [Planctomycetota bacterium]|nr:hypothetical protein [Planctomycetota bacterium]MDP6762182.1 hypothetical protein [Planctomycetota bacterium]MDP6990070.1 hypothetical protein [Planctomycetota bacterium]
MRTLRSMVGCLALAGFLLAGCASYATDRHVAPLFTQLSTAGGGEEIEAAGGAFLLRRDEPGGEAVEWGVRPLFLHSRLEEGRTKTEFLAPLGLVSRGPDEQLSRLLPFGQYQRRTHADGTRTWSYFGFPLVYFASFPDGRTVRAWLPVAGRVEKLLTFDKIEFVLWPLYMRTERDGRVARHFLFPVFRFLSGEGAQGWRVWPLAGHAHLEGNYDRWFFLWPLLSFERDKLSLPPESRRTRWSVFPFFGRARQGSFEATTVLWPFFGSSSDERSGFCSWDVWPLVRVQRPGTSKAAKRTRVWPFWSRFEGDGMTSTWWLWPLVNAREETYLDHTRNALRVTPFYDGYHVKRADGTEQRVEKVWPLFQAERGGEGNRFSFPALSPLWHMPALERHYSWLWKVFAREERAEVVRERSLLGLWRREKDADEDRRSLAGLWARRDYRRGATAVREFSLLFGLVRWRSTEGESLEWMSPSLPGPGWPLERVRASAGGGGDDPPR